MVRSSPVTPLPRRTTNTLSRSSILIKLTTRKTPVPLVTHTLTQLGLTFFNLDCDEDSSLVFIAHREGDGPPCYRVGRPTHPLKPDGIELFWTAVKIHRCKRVG
jgi:hypothetical protein